MAVSDTIEGRYEMIVLHVALLLRRLGVPDSGRARLAQAVVDFMAADLDRSIRELGVGDLSVSRFMKRLGEGLYGRATAYGGALESGDSAALGTALLRNVYAGIEPDGRILAAIGSYVRKQHEHLSLQPIARIALGDIDFLDPTDANHETLAAHS
jgi:cytochrome b pre-mRNA-processing protein 3